MVDGDICYSKLDGTYVLTFHGDIRHTVSPKLSTFLELIGNDEGLQSVLVDLRPTTNIDSTNLGQLAKVSILVTERFGVHPTIISTNPDITETLQAVAFDTVFDIIDDPQISFGECQSLPEVQTDKFSLANAVLEAHRTLAALSEKNRTQFQGVIETFEHSLRDHT